MEWPCRQHVILLKMTNEVKKYPGRRSSNIVTRARHGGGMHVVVGVVTRPASTRRAHVGYLITLAYSYIGKPHNIEKAVIIVKLSALRYFGNAVGRY